MKRIIGLSGVAGAGKDLFYTLLSKRIKCERYAFADELKEEVHDWCHQNYNICTIDCRGEEKQKIRPLLVFHGKMRRDSSKGRYWIEKLKEKMNWWEASNPFWESSTGLDVVTDVRYNAYESDEVHFIKEELKGSLVHISQYTTSEHEWKGGRKWQGPANEDEKKWDPVLKKLADYRVEWPKVDKENAEEKLIKYIDKFLVDFNK
ncbi:hypothetical protein CMI37_33675 [Candidatus Pacearchaeota archaeon]|nr:hypothetical protein [Candidatus Pacearchaeota archaeon]|tara:strand:+ start:167 stop:781 length:615 start_codon:yes stop_codon:yes gene_type:complete